MTISEPLTNGLNISSYIFHVFILFQCCAICSTTFKHWCYFIFIIFVLCFPCMEAASPIHAITPYKTTNYNNYQENHNKRSREGILHTDTFPGHSVGQHFFFFCFEIRSGNQIRRLVLSKSLFFTIAIRQCSCQSELSKCDWLSLLWGAGPVGVRAGR